MMGTTTIPFDKPAHNPTLMTSTLSDDSWILTCLELSCENSVQTSNFDQECRGMCQGTQVVITCSEGSKGGWQKL
jgi:hypothetical protein